MAQPATDTAFFTMVHNLLREQTIDSEPDRRVSERHPYNHIQLVAPYDGRRLPTQPEFHKVHCHDISTTGFSYCSSDKPETQYAVIALGRIPFLFFAAEIMHAHQINNGGAVEYLVGCRIIHRITRDIDS